MQALRIQPTIPLFDQVSDHSSVPTEVRTAAVRSGGPGRPLGRRVSATPWTGGSTAARWLRFGTAVRFVSILVSSVLIASVDGIALTVPARAEGEIKPAEDPLAVFVTEASQRFDVPIPWIRAIMNAESAGDARALSPKGAMGLMQLMPRTWSELRGRYGLGADPFDPRDNILAGTAYIRELLDRYGTPGFLAAYNAGPTRYDDHLATGRPLPSETSAFVTALVPMISGVQGVSEGNATADVLAWTRAPLFIERASGNMAANRLSSDASSARSPNAPQAVDVSALAPQSEGLFVHRLDGAERQ